MITRWKTISGMLEERCRLTPDAAAFFALDNDNCWQSISWSEFTKNVNQVSAALLAAGVERGGCIGIMAPTSLNWEYAQMGALAVAATVAGIDQNYPLDQFDLVLRPLNLSVLFVQDHATLLKIPTDLRERIKLIVLFEGVPQSNCEQNINNILAIKSVHQHVDVQAMPEPQDAAVIVFSSGTTGIPKAIVYTHEQVLTAVTAILKVFDDFNEETVLLCWLPLANLFQRVVNFCAIGIGARSYMLSDPRGLMNYISHVNPHLLIGVPKVFSRIQLGIMSRIKESAWLVRFLLHSAFKLGHEYALAKLSSRRVGIINIILWSLADKFILSRLRAVFGFRLKYVISGSAPMPLWLLEWYEGIGLPVFEAYGVSENIVPIAMNTLLIRKIGTVGKPLFPNQVKLAADGEIMVRGPGVFGGYWDDLDRGAERFSADGYWCTSDLGYFDEGGFLSLTGRKSDIFKTPEGKWVSPAQIEGQFQQIDYVEQCIVFQLDSGGVAAILSIDKERYLKKINSCAEKVVFDQQEGMDMRSRILQTDFEVVLQHLPKYQHPVGIIVTYVRFTVEAGELTTNMKLRRGAIINHFSLYINQLEAEFTEMLKCKQTRNVNTVVSPILLFV